MAPNNLIELDALKDWQKNVGDDVLLSKLSIPGTHNSAASHKASLPTVKCQNASVTKQLEHGIRFLDLRVAKQFVSLSDDKENLQIIHGKFPVRIPLPVHLSSILDEVYEFLHHHQSEIVIVSIKQEGDDKWENDDFPNLIWDRYIEPNQDKWYLQPGIPRLGDARGRAVLFRRFGVKDDNKRNNYGFEASWWDYNTTRDDRGEFIVQDWCELNQEEDIEKKANYIKDGIKDAAQYNATNSDPKLYLNFCSGANFFEPSCWPKKVAEGLKSKGIEDSFNKECGIVVMDFVANDDWASTRSLVSFNFD